MKPKNKQIILIAAISLFSTLILWLPFLLNTTPWLGFQIPPLGMKTIWANYDGSNYIIIAKTWYNMSLIGRSFSFPLPLEYYPAHWPGYPLLIKFFNFFLGTPQAMLVSTLTTSILAAISFYLFLKKSKLSINPFWLTIVFLFLPARHLVLRSVGAPEPLFIFTILASFYFFRQKKYWPAAIFGSLAQLTKSPGILLFIAYTAYILYDSVKNKRKDFAKAWPLLFIPFTILGVFTFYKIQTGDFWAYFHSGDNFHLTTLPFQALNSARSWLGGIWNEDMIWLYLIGAVGVITLFKKKLTDLAIFATIFYLATIFVAHRDLSRYSLPMWPFLLIAFDPFLQKKEFKIAFLIILPAIYLYSLNFILGNTAPIADWTPYL